MSLTSVSYLWPLSSPRWKAPSSSQHFILGCKTILAHASRVFQRGRHVAVAKHLLYSLHVCFLPNAKLAQAVAQVVEPEADVLAFLERASRHRSGTEIIFDQHVRDAGLLTFMPGAGKNPVRRLTVRCLLLALANEACE